MHGKLELMISRPAVLNSVLISLYTIVVLFGFYVLRAQIRIGVAQFTGWNVHGEFRYGNDVFWLPMLLIAPIVAVTAVAVALGGVKGHLGLWIRAMLCVLVLRTTFMLTVWNATLTWPFLYGSVLRSWLPERWNTIYAYTAIDVILFGVVLLAIHLIIRTASVDSKQAS